MLNLEVPGRGYAVNRGRLPLATGLGPLIGGTVCAQQAFILFFPPRKIHHDPFIVEIKNKR